MIIFSTPNNKNDYFMTNGKLAYDLQQAGFHPKYRDFKFIYFKKSHDLVNYLTQLGIIVKT